MALLGPYYNETQEQITKKTGHFIINYAKIALKIKKFDQKLFILLISPFRYSKFPCEQK